MKYGEQEKEITSIRVYSKNSIGCKKHKKDIMISYIQENTDGIIDLFLTQEQAEFLLDELNKSIEINKGQ